jgi:hypothetical protein
MRSTLLKAKGWITPRALEAELGWSPSMVREGLKTLADAGEVETQEFLDRTLDSAVLPRKMFRRKG